MGSHGPRMSPQRAERLRRWHEDASAELHRRGACDIDYLGLRLHVPAEVFAPTPTSDLLGRAVMAHVRPGQRVLDMGCGAGANAILAAAPADEVLAVDVNPHAVAATAANAERNGVAHRIRCAKSDVFDLVDGDFDVIVIDPPFSLVRAARSARSCLYRRGLRHIATLHVGSRWAASSRRGGAVVLRHQWRRRLSRRADRGSGSGEPHRRRTQHPGARRGDDLLRQKPRAAGGHRAGPID